MLLSVWNKEHMITGRVELWCYSVEQRTADYGTGFTLILQCGRMERLITALWCYVTVLNKEQLFTVRVFVTWATSRWLTPHLRATL